MEQRFRREKNITETLPKKTQQKKSPLPSGEHEETTGTSGDVFFRALRSSYLQMKKSRSCMYTVLISFVFIFFIFIVGYIFPRLADMTFGGFHISDFLISTEQSKIPEDTDIDILILGRGGNENDAPDLTDAIIYGHYDVASKSFSTVSIPRDLIVHSKLLGNVKINEIYSSSKRKMGEEIAFQNILDIVSEIVGRKIPHYVLVDFSGFRSLIDHIGGVDIMVPDRLYDPEYPTKNWGYTVVDIQPGMQHFDGDKALKYSRSRHTTSDFDRSHRQQAVLNAVREKLLSTEVLTSPKKIEGIFTILRQSLRTDFSLPELLHIAQIMQNVDSKLLLNYSLDVSCFETLKFCHPGGFLYTPERELFGGSSVILPKKGTVNKVAAYDDISKFVHIVTTYPTLSRASPITLINASGRTNLALSVAIRLRALGFPVDESLIKNQKERVQKTFLRYRNTPPLIDSLLEPLSLIFYGEKRIATETEISTMNSPYEIVLGTDSSLYF